jgi:hypothetical protein
MADEAIKMVPVATHAALIPNSRFGRFPCREHRCFSKAIACNMRSKVISHYVVVVWFLFHLNLRDPYMVAFQCCRFNPVQLP